MTTPARPKVLITNWVPDDHLEPLLGWVDIIKGPTGGPMLSRAEVLALAPELAGIINQHELSVDRELLAAAPNLRIVANVAIGHNNLDLAAMTESGVWATNTPDAFAEATADHTLALLLAVARRIPSADRYVQSGQWEIDGFQPGPWDGMLLSGKVFGTVGFGQIARAAARRAEAFGMTTIFHNTSGQADPRYRPFDELLAEADVVSLHLPLTPASHHLINARALTLMKPHAILLNLARGPVVDEAAVAAALDQGHLYGAAFDVAEREPTIHPSLLSRPNVVFSPHIGGGTTESRRTARLTCAQNIAQALKNQTPPNALNELTPSESLKVSKS